MSDKQSPPGKLHVGGSSVLVQKGLASTNKVKNFLAAFGLPFRDSTSNKLSGSIIYTRTSPAADTDYAELEIGSICIQIAVTATAASDANVYIKTDAGWEKFTTDQDALRNAYMLVSTLTGTAGLTLTAAQMQGGIIAADPAGAGRTQVTPTAALIVAAIPDAKVGASMRFVIMNTADAAETLTLTAGVGVTLNPTTVTIPQGCRREFIAICTNVTAAAQAVTMYEMGDIAASHMIVAAGASSIASSSSGSLTIAGIQATDEIQATIKTDNGTNGATIETAVASAGGIDYVLSATVGSASTLSYAALRAR